MRLLAKQALLLILMLSAFGARCWCADGLVGTWRTEMTRQSQPGTTNTVESFGVISFLKDGSLKMSDVLIINGDRHTNVSFRGTYTMTSSNRTVLTLLAQDVPARSYPRPVTLSCSVTGDELLISKLITSVVPEHRKYRRVK